MLLQILTVIYVLVAIAMVVLILMQRGAGAQAGSCLLYTSPSPRD